MTSVFYEDIHLNSDSLKSIQKCEEFSKSQERLKLDEERKSVMQRIAKLRKEKEKAMAKFKTYFGENPPNEKQEGEATAFSDWWYYEGIDNPDADTPLTGYYLNRGPKAVMSALRAFAQDVENFLNTPIQTEQIADKAITYEKLDDNVKSLLGGGTSSTSSGDISIVEDNIRVESSSTRLTDL